jgi:alkane 1-monooxygenase
MSEFTFERRSAGTNQKRPINRFSVWRFLFAFAVFALPVLGTWAASAGWPALSYLPFIVVYLTIPVIDILVKHAQQPQLNRQSDIDQLLTNHGIDLPLLCIPAWLVTLFVTLWMAQSLSGLSWLACVIGLGIAGGISGITPAHELIHRGHKLHRAAGGLLMASVNYGPFKIEHIRGHHRWVGTPKDPATARRGQSFYSFFIQSLIGNYAGGYALERARLKQQNLSWFRSEFWHWVGLSFAFAFMLWLIAGWQAVGGFYIVSLAAIFKLELINYIEHYGLTRQQNEHGQYEPVTQHHSWNCNTWFINAILFNVQRHADHHAFPSRDYRALRDCPQAPQLPLGYASMVLAALLPPLWFRLMDTRLDQFKQASQSNQSPQGQARAASK